MDSFWTETGLALPEGMMLARVSGRLISAVLLAALIGWEREARSRAAGLRTHMMVALGSALFTIVPLEEGATASDLAQIIKGIAAGIGFLGAGAILKLTREKDIIGLTTAATIWLTAAVGLTVGAGHFWIGLIATTLSLVILQFMERLEVYAGTSNGQKKLSNGSQSHEDPT